MFTDVHRFAFSNEVRFTKHGTELPCKIEISAMVSNNNPGSFYNKSDSSWHPNTPITIPFPLLLQLTISIVNDFSLGKLHLYNGLGMDPLAVQLTTPEMRMDLNMDLMSFLTSELM